MSTNDITGDKLQTKTTTDAYRDGWEKIFGKKDKRPIRHSCGEILYYYTGKSYTLKGQPLESSVVLHADNSKVEMFEKMISICPKCKLYVEPADLWMDGDPWRKNTACTK